MNPIDFDIYGIVNSVEYRWLELYQADPNLGLWEIDLAHLTRDPALLLVKTAPRLRYEIMVGGSDPIRHFAFDCAHTLINWLPPSFANSGDRDRYTSAIVSHVEAVANSYSTLPRVDWTVDDEQRSAYVWAFAQAWAGFLADVEAPSSYLGVVGCGLPPSPLVVSTVDLGDYRVDDRTDPSLHLSAANRPDEALERFLASTRQIHPDHLAVLKGETQYTE